MLTSIKAASDLETTYDEKKLGFLAVALRKSKEAQHYLDLSYSLKAEIIQVRNPEELLLKNGLIVPLCQAAGISTKAQCYLHEDDVKELLKDFFDEYILPLGNDYSDELVGRYLLALGDALGGRMRNIVGAMASEKLSEKIISAIVFKGYKFKFYDKLSKKWIEGENFADENKSNVKAICWTNARNSRTLLYDITVPLVRKNIDLVLLDGDYTKNFEKTIKDNLKKFERYIALGELKGGIDPAGADEHWKTAGTALNRIRLAFEEKNHPIETLFIGAAIEKAMASEMFDEVTSKKLSKCANLTKSLQLAEICNWLVEL
jgi:type II restriction enzyme